MAAPLDFWEGDIPKKGELIQVIDNIYWIRLPLPLSLDHINLYLIDEGDAWAVIDTGIKFPESEAIWNDIIDNQLGGKPIKKVVVTHMHPDHIGLAGWLVERFDADFYISQAEYFATFGYLSSGSPSIANQAFFSECGLPQAFLAFIAENPFDLSHVVHPIPEQYIRLREGETINLGGHDWQILTGEGHSFEHVALYSKSLGCMLSGDQLLPKITSNVSVHSIVPQADSLRYWFESLEQLRAIPNETLVLPSHNVPFKGVHQRVDQIIDHHQRHLNALEKVLDEPKTAYELLPTLFPIKLTHFDMPLAMGECVAHLNYLIMKQRLQSFVKESVRYYEKVHAC